MVDARQQPWTSTTLGEVIQPRNIRKPPSAIPELPFIGLEHVESYTGKIVGSSTTRHVKSNVALFYKGDVLYGRLRPYLNKVIIAPYDGAASAEFIIFPGDNGNIDRTFLRYRLRSPEFLEFTSLLDRGDRPRVKWDQIREFAFRMPRPEQQYAIGHMLDASLEHLHELRSEARGAKALAHRLSAETLRRVFAGALSTNDDAAEPKQVNAEDKTVQALPPSWSWTTLPDLGYLGRGKSRHRPRNAPHLFGGPYPFIQTGEVRAANGRIAQFSSFYSEAGLAQSKLWPKGTVCITIAANIADTAILDAPACFPDSVVGFIADESKCLPEYIELFLRTARSDLAAFAPATAQKNINLETLRDVRVPLAPLDEQKKIVAFVQKIVGAADAIQLESGKSLILSDRLEKEILSVAMTENVEALPASVRVTPEMHTSEVDARKNKELLFASG